MKVLVAGGAGFIGTNFVRLLMAETDWEVINYDLLTYAGNLTGTRVFDSDRRYAFVQGDICDREAIARTLSERDVEVVVNFAAESHVDRSIHDAAEFIRTNIGGTQVLLEECRKSSVRLMLQVSTDEVYGDLKSGEPAFTESSPIRPSSPYSASKASADLLARAAFRTHGQPVIITRCSNNYGPYQYPEKFIPLSILKITNDERIPVYGKGENVRDWIYVTDHCRGILAAIQRGVPGSVYNFGGASELTNIDLAKLLLRKTCKPESLISFVKDRPGHDFRYAIDYSKAERELGWRPLTAFGEGIAKTIEWYSSHGEWLKATASGELKDFMEKHYG